jgi:hypothetical protein
MKIREMYQDKTKRDARAKELKQQGLEVTRRSTGVCLLHPQYVTDFTGPEKHDTGLGNRVYKTYFKNLYVVEVA